MKLSNIAKARETLKRHTESAKASVNQITGDAITTATSWGIGYARHRWPERMTIGDTDVEIPLVIAAKVAAFGLLGTRTAAGHSVHAVGTGIAAGYAYLNGAEVGSKHRAQDHTAAQAASNVTRIPERQAV